MSETDGILNFNFRKCTEKNVRVYVDKNASKRLQLVLGDLKPDKVFIVCDTNVAKLYADEIEETISKLHPVYTIVHEAGEQGKNLQTITKISDLFFEKNGTSNSCLVALGGGVTGNVAGFFASIVFRGIRLIHVPTTLLAQVDSAADVKQSVNSANIKNSIGSYKAPDVVIIDPTLLKTLDDREIRSGLGEVVKHGLAQDIDFVEYIISCDYRDIDVLQTIVMRTIKLKIEHWNSTPSIWNDKHKTERLTHLGHTTGKILEMIEVDYLTHGEAISHGMVIESYMSYKLGYMDFESLKKIQSVLTTLRLLYPLSIKYTKESIILGLYASTDKPIFALLKELGNPQTISTVVPERLAQEAVEWYLEQTNGR